jgi:DNA repair photolyase
VVQNPFLRLCVSARVNEFEFVFHPSDHFPDRKEKVLNRIRSIRGGKLHDSNFGSRMRGQGPWAEQIRELFHVAKRKAGITGKFPQLSVEQFRKPKGTQGELFE